MNGEGNSHGFVKYTPMSVDDWARREAEREFGDGHTDPEGYGFEAGIVHAFDALLSDETVEAAAIGIAQREGVTWSLIHRHGVKANFLRQARAALQAAISAVTKGDTDE